MKTFNLFFLVCTLTAISSSILAQSNKYDRIYYKVPDKLSTKVYNIEFDDPVSKEDYVKMAIRIENNTDDYLLVKKNETTFLINDKELKAEKGSMFGKKVSYILPNKTIRNTFKSDGATNYLVDKFSLDIDGIYVVPAEGKVHDAPNFKLPASKNKIKFGDYEVKLKKLRKKTKTTVAVFEVEYNGKDIGVVNASKLGVTIPDEGNDEFANDWKGDAELLESGGTCTIKAEFHISARYADMQFANMEILWRDTFQSSKPKKTKANKVDFEIDPGLTEGKN